jgi:hypothetical protein
MRIRAAICLVLVAGSTAARASDAWLDQLDDALSVSSGDSAVRAHLSGAFDLEAYDFPQPPPGLIYGDGHALVDPRLSLYFDAQLGPAIYVFAESRVDRGFDPSAGTLRLRLDEYAARLTPWADGRFNLQVGKFATVVGSWAPRHDSWDNAFVTAPLAYDNLTGVWDVATPRTTGILMLWGNSGTNPAPNNAFPNKQRSLPIIWGPSYASGAAVSGQLGAFDYAAEVKNRSLSSRPDTWDVGEMAWTYPTVSGRLGYRPDESWNFGVSASTGSYLQAIAAPTVAPGTGLGDYREVVFGQDASYAWHHWQVWAELYEASFRIPRLGNFDTESYYVETKLKFTPQFFGALRWNQQLFTTVATGAATTARWGNNIWRIDAGPGYRFSAHVQLKLQYSLQDQDGPGPERTGLLSAQYTVRF